MNEDQNPDLVNAEEALRTRKGDADALRQLEKRLAKQHDDDLAREVRLLRTELDVAAAETILNGGGSNPPDMLKLAKRLAEYKRIGLARRILKRARLKPKLNRTAYPAIYVEVFQKSALYTYKDPDLPLEWRLDEALRILGEPEDLAKTMTQETLGLAGAIFKRKWEVDGLRQNLERALSYYQRGYAIGIQSRHVAADRGAKRRAAAARLTTDSLEDVRSDVFTYLRENPDCELWADEDRGYCGINAAFVLDVLAHEEDKDAARPGLPSAAANEKRTTARLIREEIQRSVLPLLGKPGNEWLADEWWFYATLGEVFFGLGSHEEAAFKVTNDPQHQAKAAAYYGKAIDWLVEAPKNAGLKSGLGQKTPAGMEVPEWEYESTARQLARLTRSHSELAVTEGEFERTQAGKTLAMFLGDDEKAVGSTFRGKFGLGLSGGGFRASLFHIGVLARLAELDVLRHIEVLSCVSGGSIIGAHYYLEVRQLLQTKTDDQITRADYIGIVKRIERDFLEGVQRNIRTRVLAEWATNLRMIFTAGYTRTLRVGELYERELFSKVKDVAQPGNSAEPFGSPVTGAKWLPDWLARIGGCRREKRWLNDLYIKPLGSGHDFNPRSHNWRRLNKAPILILNAACLNTGHNWQFTASFMGEPPAPLNTDIDSNYRLRRMYYKDATQKYQTFRLGHAVAASSCVPGLFPPLPLDGLYPESDEKLREQYLISVQLVDGGACDNQGVSSLLEQDCTVMLISDASGQMEADNAPRGDPLSVLLRTTNIVQARVREAQYMNVVQRRRSSLLRGLMFIHLRQNLPGGEVNWKDCPSSLRESDFERDLTEVEDELPYHVDADVQRKLAAIRTDLDSFHEAEAFALMMSAYRMTAAQFDGDTKRVEGFPKPLKTEDWRFLAVEPAMKFKANGEARKRLEELLEVGANGAFKIWKLSAPLRWLKIGLLVAVIAWVVWLFYILWNVALSPQAVYARIEPYLPALVTRHLPALTFGLVGTLILGALLMMAVAASLDALVGKKFSKLLIRGIDWQSTLRNIAVGIGMSTVGFIAARLHLHVFDPLYLRYGKIARIAKR